MHSHVCMHTYMQTQGHPYQTLPSRQTPIDPLTKNVGGLPGAARPILTVHYCLHFILWAKEEGVRAKFGALQVLAAQLFCLQCLTQCVVLLPTAWIECAPKGERQPERMVPTGPTGYAGSILSALMGSH